MSAQSGPYGQILLAALLAGAIYGLGNGAWWLRTHAVDSSPLHADGQTATWQPDLDDGQEIVFRARPLGDFSQTLSRPLFEPERRPFVPKAPEPVADDEPTAPQPPAPEIPREKLRIVGVKIFKGTRQALIVSENDKTGQWVSKGDSIGGWKVVTVQAGSAIVAAGSQRQTLTLYVDKP